MRALVTGATGCVGANVVEALIARGYNVCAMRRKNSRLDALAGLNPDYIVADVMDTSSLEKAMSGCDLVFHVAAISEYWRTTPENIYLVNVTGTRHVLQTALRLHVSRVIFTSSVAVFGRPTHKGEILDEKSRYQNYPIPFHYGRSKVLAEVEVADYIRKGLDVVVVNPATVIGQRDINHIGGEIIRVAQKGWLLAAPAGGMGVVSAKDVGTGHVLAAEAGKTGERYILNGENVTHYHLLKTIAAETASRQPMITIPRSIGFGLAELLHLIYKRGIRFAPIDPIQIYLSALDLYFDASKAEQELGFTSRSAKEAVSEAVSWYARYGAA